MKCAVHTEVESTYFCRHCGKPLCPSCCHLIQGQAFCESCLAQTVAGPHPGPLDGPNPWLAFGLGWIPGVGAVVNGEYAKAAVHVAIFAGIITLLANGTIPNGEPFLGVFLGLFCVYMPFEAYQTARRKQLEAAGASTAQPGMTQSKFYQDFWTDWKLNAPIGGIILVIIGVLFLLDTMQIYPFGRFFRLWPIALILIGIVMLRGRLAGRK
ncbi:MAG: DUF5668 domain-containing protein [Acidobacteriia bacterium]|nr:DUF5668 domain-containing protein [Terriglobia bacterium]